MKAVQLRNKNGILTYCNGSLAVENLATGDVTHLTGSEEFVLYVEKGGIAKALPSCSFKRNGVSVNEGCFVVKYSNGDIDVRVVYKSTEEVFVKEIEVAARERINLKRITLECRKVHDSYYGGGEGIPVFIGDKIWCGIEFPAAMNRAVDGALSLYQAPFASVDYFRSFPVVYGLNTCGKMKAAFENYVKSFAVKKKPMILYCDWAAHDDLSNGPILSDEFSLKNIEEVNDFSKKSSVPMDYYLMDAFWFEENKGYMNFKPSTFPEGSKNVVKKLDEYGMKYGLWFDINFIHAHMEGWEKYDSMINKGASCFALDEVANLMTEAVAKHIVEDGVKLLKFDFAYFECKNPEHGHSIETTESKERSIVNFIKMVERLREIEPELVILCYNGWTVSLDWIGCVCERAGYAISPYWCKYIDYLYCGDPRPSEIATKDMENSLVYYSDAMIRNFRDSFIPFKYIDDHGTMVGETDTIYNLGDKLFRSTTLLNVMRGTEKMSPYGQVTNLTDEDAEYFRYVNSIFNVAVNGGYTCSFILGDIRKGEVYGYSLGGSQHGYAIILNPLKHNVNVNVKLEQWGDVNVSVVKRIENGDIVSSRASTVSGGIAVPVAANGYVLLEWRVADDKTEGQFVTVCPNEKLAFCTENISAVALSFKKADDGTPVRTAFGYPEGLTVKSGDDQLKANVSNCVWSGISWLYFELSGEKEVCIEYSGNEILLMKYELIKESGK